MKILHTTEFYAPSVGGMQEVVRQLSERLARSGHQVTVATTFLPERSGTTLAGVDLAPFRIRGNWVTGCTGETERYREFLLQSDFDIVTNFAAQQWTTDLALDVLTQIRAKKVFVPTGFSKLDVPRFHEYYRLMPGWMNQYQMNVFHSNGYRDIEFARASGVGRLTVIPNGAGRDEFAERSGADIRRRLGIPRHHLLILHVGSHTGTKGHHSAIEIFRRAGLRGATLLLVAGSSRGGCARRCRISALAHRLSPDHLLHGNRLLVAELSRTETVEAYHEADLFLFPSAIECSPLVLFECLASRTPFLTTDVGNAAEIIEWSGGGLLLPTNHLPGGNSRADLPGSVRLLRRIANQPDERRALATSGYQAWEERFSWERIAPQYEQLYRSLVEEKP